MNLSIGAKSLGPPVCLRSVPPQCAGDQRLCLDSARQKIRRILFRTDVTTLLHRNQFQNVSHSIGHKRLQFVSRFSQPMQCNFRIRPEVGGCCRKARNRVDLVKQLAAQFDGAQLQSRYGNSFDKMQAPS